jgi:transposase-like protein
MTKPRQHRSRAEWEDLVRRHRESGLSIVKFAAQHGVSDATLGRWIQKINKRNHSVLPSPTALLPVTSTSSSTKTSAIILVVGPVRLHLSPGFDRALLTEVLRTLSTVFS